jgi:hypothetical protein
VVARGRERGVDADRVEQPLGSMNVVLSDGNRRL